MGRVRVGVRAGTAPTPLRARAVEPKGDPYCLTLFLADLQVEDEKAAVGLVRVRFRVRVSGRVRVRVSVRVRVRVRRRPRLALSACAIWMAPG